MCLVCMKLVMVTVRSETHLILDCLNTRIIGVTPSQGMDLCYVWVGRPVMTNPPCNKESCKMFERFTLSELILNQSISMA
jgi:hypothetical protein